jgi:hypothetical protein
MVANRIRASLRQGVVDFPRGTFQHLDYTPQDALDHFTPLLERGCAICYQPIEGPWDISHIQPLAAAKTSEEVVRLFALNNLTVAHASCNRRLGARAIA